MVTMQNRTPQNIETKGKGRLKREATEAEIINAFDRLVRREGLRNVRVNAVIKEAGVGKGLLYTYFGGLPGLVKAWGEREKIWPDIHELVEGVHIRGSGQAELALTLKTLILNHARFLREEPLRVELLADEFMNSTSISAALSVVRQQLGKEHQAIFELLPELRDYDAQSLFTILMAAASYLAMRAVRSPRYMGENIATDEEWSNLVDRFERIIDLAVLGSNVEQMVKEGGFPKAAE